MRRKGVQLNALTDAHTDLPPERLVADITAKEKRIVEIMAEIDQALKAGR